MSQMCCLPGCDNRTKNCTLFKIPSKKFLTGAKHAWADDLEKIILGYRSDTYINELFKRDLVKICEKHFLPEDFKKKGKRLELIIGAIPSQNMPVKSVITPSHMPRAPPKERQDLPKMYHKDLHALKNSCTRYIPNDWKMTEDYMSVFLSLFDGHDQPKYAVEFDKNLDTSVYYYGWRTVHLDIDIRYCTLTQFLHDIESSMVCKGVEENSHWLFKHVVTKRAEKGKGNVPTVSTICSRIKELENRVQELLENSKSFVEVDDDLAGDFSTIIEQGLQRNEIDDFHRLFWKEQKRLTGSSSNGARYHPEIIRFCLSLAAKSRSAYEELRDSGILRLPSSRTLCDYRNVYHTSPGIQQHVINEVKERCQSMNSSERYVALSVDEMKVKENLVYCGSTDSMVGFVDLGTSRNNKDTEVIATHALQFYVRSITGNFSRPLVFYGTRNITAHSLSSMFLECVACLEKCGLHTIALIADGATCNRKMFSILNNMNLDIPYKCANIYNPDLPIYLISDPPHLLKTTCNNIRGSKPGGPRLLKYGPHFILWSHFRRVPQLFQSSELRCCKLTEGHFSNQSFAKMRVCYAAQLLSGSVSRLMKERGGDEMIRSAWIASLMNQWFDCMNTRRWYGHNKNLRPITATNDERLLWLNNFFLKELENWRGSLSGTATEKSKQFLSYQTYQGLVGTTKAIVEISHFLLENCEEGTCILTRRLNQDPLEAYFGHMRQIGRRCEAPDLNQYAQFENVITTKKKIKSLKGSNVTRSGMNWKDAPISSQSLPKRQGPRLDKTLCPEF